MAISFPEEGGGSFSLISKHLCKKKFVMIAVEKNPISFQYIDRNLKDDDDIFKLAFQQNEGYLRYASERFRKTNLQS